MLKFENGENIHNVTVSIDHIVEQIQKQNINDRR